MPPLPPSIARPPRARCGVRPRARSTRSSSVLTDDCAGSLRQGLAGRPPRTRRPRGRGPDGGQRPPGLRWRRGRRARPGGRGGPGRSQRPLRRGLGLAEHRPAQCGWQLGTGRSFPNRGGWHSPAHRTVQCVYAPLCRVGGPRPAAKAVRRCSCRSPWDTGRLSRARTPGPVSCRRSPTMLHPLRRTTT